MPTLATAAGSIEASALAYVSSGRAEDKQRYLDELDAQELIHRVKRGRYSLPSRESLVAGVLSCHRDGYGFVAPDDRTVYKQDIYVHSRNMDEAMHGDRVLVKVARKKQAPRRGRRDGATLFHPVLTRRTLCRVARSRATAA